MKLASSGPGSGPNLAQHAHVDTAVPQSHKDDTISLLLGTTTPPTHTNTECTDGHVAHSTDQRPSHRNSRHDANPEMVTSHGSEDHGDATPSPLRTCHKLQALRKVFMNLNAEPHEAMPSGQPKRAGMYKVLAAGFAQEWHVCVRQRSQCVLAAQAVFSPPQDAGCG